LGGGRLRARPSSGVSQHGRARPLGARDDVRPRRRATGVRVGRGAVGRSRRRRGGEPRVARVASLGNRPAAVAVRGRRVVRGDAGGVSMKWRLGVGVALLAGVVAVASIDLSLAVQRWDELGPVPPGEPMPALSFATLEGEALDTAALRGRVTVLTFWTTWCPACRS